MAVKCFFLLPTSLKMGKRRFSELQKTCVHTRSDQVIVISLLYAKPSVPSTSSATVNNSGRTSSSLQLTGKLPSLQDSVAYGHRGVVRCLLLDCALYVSRGCERGLEVHRNRRDTTLLTRCSAETIQVLDKVDATFALCREETLHWEANIGCKVWLQSPCEAFTEKFDKTGLVRNHVVSSAATEKNTNSQVFL